tara:strand:- start:167 stop:583 length:417 start_codon:yes stop_codon:yes gene_type:complete
MSAFARLAHPPTGGLYTLFGVGESVGDDDVASVVGVDVPDPGVFFRHPPNPTAGKSFTLFKIGALANSRFGLTCPSLPSLALAQSVLLVRGLLIFAAQLPGTAAAAAAAGSLGASAITGRCSCCCGHQLVAPSRTTSG